MKKILSLILVLALSIALVACGTTEVATEEEMVELEGDVIVDGSGTVYPLMANIAEEYMVNKEENVSVQVGRAGSSAGFKKFIPGGITTWADIRPEWPAEEINFYGPNENHGTYEFFYEKILDEQDMVASASLQQEYSTLVDLVANDVAAIAYFGFGYYVSNTDKLQAVHIDFGNGPIEPTLETIGTDLDYAGFTPLPDEMYETYQQELDALN